MFGLRQLFIQPIRWYQKLVSPWLGSRCRFEPSCSEFAIQAIDQFGVILGLVKTVARLLRCHPLFPGGYDPPEKAWPRIGKARGR